MQSYLRVYKNCCTKYKNLPVNWLDGEEMLYFIQQFGIWVDILAEMLYFVQDFNLYNNTHRSSLVQASRRFNPFT